MDIEDNVKSVVLHVVVVGFHHKKGCQVEYSYPPLIEGNEFDSHECPEEWKHLPSLALPDGSHNYDEDTVYFVMPARNIVGKSVFCISCYRQMNAKNLLNRSADITRDSVQKSVCVISTLPLFGIIQAKLELITHAYFEERDFSKVSLLEDTFRSLNACLSYDLVKTQQVFLGMPIRELVVQFKHKVLLLFKLILLERRVLVFNTPVKNLCSNILSLLSIFPDMIQYGLDEAANSTIDEDDDASVDVLCSDAKVEDLSLPASPGIKNKFSPGGELKNDLDAATPENRNKYEDPFKTCTDSIASMESVEAKSICLPDVTTSEENQLMSEIEELLDEDCKEKVALTKSKLEFHNKDFENINNDDDSENTKDDASINNEDKESNSGAEASNKISNIKGRMIGAISSYWSGRSSVASPEFEGSQNLSPSFSNGKLSELMNSKLLDSGKEEIIIEKVFTPSAVIVNMENDACGFPLQIFTKGVMCHPYLSLPYLDTLAHNNIRGFIVGATNVLFKQKQCLSDAVIEIDDGKIEVSDVDLRKQLHLTTEDLRFADYLVRNVTEENGDVFLDGTAGWEGGDEWLRAQFKYYLVCLLRTSLLEDGNKELEAFNLSFVDAWKTTHNYKTWKNQHLPLMAEISTGHPFQGQLSVADMKLRLSHTMQSSERGRRINQAMTNTGRAVVQTSKAVGGALTQAKSAVSSWLYTFSSPPGGGNPAQ